MNIRNEKRDMSDETQESNHFFLSHIPAPRSFSGGGSYLISHFLFFLVIAAALFVGRAVHAAEITTSADIRAATNFALEEKGFCAVKKDEESADCKKQTTFCDANEWIAFVNANVEFVGGSVPTQKQGWTQYAAILPDAVSSGTILPDSVYTYLRKDPRNRSRIVPLGEASCFCLCGNSDSEKACTDKEVGTPFQVQQGRLFTREECASACGTHKLAQRCAGSLPGIEEVDMGSAEGAAAASTASSAADDRDSCFTKDECAEQKGVYEADTRKICSSGTGRCVAPDATVPLNTPIGSVTSITGITSYIAVIFRYALSVLIVITTVMFVWGSFLYLLGSGFGKIEKGREIIKDAIIGMILVLSSVMILRTLNPATVNFTKLKLYMVNARRFVSASYCRDLVGNDLLADAGEPPSLKSFEEATKAGFSISKKNADCGHSFYIQGSIGGTCTGTTCSKKGEACVSCASGEPKDCAGIKSSRMVCDETTFGGTIQYSGGFYPKKAYLIFACNWAQSTDKEVISDSIKQMNVLASKTALMSGSTQTDTDKSGQGSFKIQFTEDNVAAAVDFCQDKGGLRGVLLGIKYNNPGLHATEAWVIDGILSKGNCSSNQFDGYSNDGAFVETTRLADALDCGMNRRKPPRFINPSMDYWSLEELTAAADGRVPIVCNFILDSSSSSDNVAKMCPDD